MAGLRLTADYHTHTVFSHGKGTVEDNIKAALDRGLTQIGIADHGPLHLSYGIRDLGIYLDHIYAMKEKYAGRIDVLAGLECNLLGLSGNIDLPQEYAKRLDVRIFGYHKFVKTSDMRSALHFFGAGKNNAEKNTLAFEKAMEAFHMNIISHPGYGIQLDLPRIAAACRKNGVAFEINNKHHDFTADELRECIASECLFVISSDAHSPEAVGRCDEALALAEAAGIPAERILNAEYD